MKTIIGSGLLVKDGTFLLVNANVGSAKGLWNNPGGHKDDGESTEECAKREVKEETGYDVVIKKLIGTYTRHAEKHVFETKIISGNLVLPKDEIGDAKWFTIEEVKKLKNITFGARQSILDYSIGKYNQQYKTNEVP